MTASPLDDFKRLVRELPAFAGDDGGADRLQALAAWLAAAQRKKQGTVRQANVALFAGSHGAVRHGISMRTPAEVAERIGKLGQGDARLNGLCSAYDLGLKVFELALDLPAADITEHPALDDRSAAATVAFGMEAIAGGADLLVVAGMGAGGAIVAAALGAALTGGSGGEWGDSAAVPRHVRLRRAETIDRALRRAGAPVSDPIEAMAQLGGREIAAAAGAIIAARSQGCGVILDGEQAAAAALALHAANCDAIRHCLLAHRLPVAAMADAARGAGLHPLLGLGFHANEGEGGALAAGIVKAAVASPAR